MPHTLLSTVAVALMFLWGCDRDNQQPGSAAPPGQPAHPVTQPGSSVPNQPRQTVTPLTDADRQRLQDQRAVVDAFISNDVTRQKYQTVAGKLGAIQAILEGGNVKPTQKYELQCLGVVFGDALVQDQKMEWVMVEDQYGRDPAVRALGTSIILFPLTTISKRVERGETVDVRDLFNQTVAKVVELRQRGV